MLTTSVAVNFEPLQKYMLSRNLNVHWVSDNVDVQLSAIIGYVMLFSYHVKGCHISEDIQKLMGSSIMSGLGRGIYGIPIDKTSALNAKGMIAKLKTKSITTSRYIYIVFIVSLLLPHELGVFCMTHIFMISI